MPLVTNADPDEYEKTIAKLRKKYGNQTVKAGNESERVLRVPTGSYELDYATGGGFPIGRWSRVYGGPSSGKALAIDTPVPTPSGWVVMGDIEVGDVVFDEKGNKVNVIDTTEVFLPEKAYEVEFDDGSVIVADGRHKWVTSTASSRRSQNSSGKSPYCVVSTDDIAESLTHTYYGGAKPNHAVANANPLDADDAVLAVHPYLLGVWLGDGDSNSGCFTTSDQQIIDEIVATGREVTKLSSFYRWNIKGLSRDLVELGVRDNKHVPSEYLRASVWQRLELVRGLMDSDGEASRNGNLAFGVTHRPLAEGMSELLNSLGIKHRVRETEAKLDGRVIGKFYRMSFSSRLNLFKLERKLERQHLRAERARKSSDYRRITNAIEIDPVPVRCISVDSDSRLFLAGNSMIPTHNSLTCWNLARNAQNIHLILGDKIASSIVDAKEAGDKKYVEWLKEQEQSFHERFPEGMSVVYYNVEQQYDPEFVASRGVDISPGKFIVIEGTTIEEIGEAIENLVPYHHLHIIDSASHAISLAELEMQVEEQRRGTSAKQWGLMLRRANARFSTSNLGVIVDQVRVNQHTGGEQAPGGKFLDHISSMTVHMRKQTWLYRRKDGSLTDDKQVINTLSGVNEPDGIEVKAIVEKSRVGRPFRGAMLRLDFDGMGWDLNFEIVKAGLFFGELRKSGSWYYVLDENGKDLEKFQGEPKLLAYLDEHQEIKQRILATWRENTKK